MINLPKLSVLASLFWIMMPLLASAQQPYQIYPKADPTNPNEEVEWNPTVGRLEAACQVTANFSTCLSYYQLWCSQGFPKACYFQQLANTNPQFFQQAINVNSACTRGDQNACNWLIQQFGY